MQSVRYTHIAFHLTKFADVRDCYLSVSGAGVM